jgi:predicted phage terminase large subunit-like protein
MQQLLGLARTNPRASLSFLEQTVLKNTYQPHKPTPKQANMLVAPEKEVMFGGAAGGGKSDGLLMDALQFVEYPGYSALLLRRTYKDLSLPDALMDRAFQWLYKTNAKWNEAKKTWTFPSGAKIVFGYLARLADVYQYQGAAFQFIGFDELTQFEKFQYTYLFSRLRRLEGVHIPLRMHSATNPGNIGHEWVKERFISKPTERRLFIPSFLQDNPHLDREAYRESLQELDPVTRRQLEEGDWDVLAGGEYFKRHWFKPASYDFDEANKIPLIPKMVRLLRFWDLAGTEAKKGKDPDWTVGLLAGLGVDGNVYFLDQVRFRGSPEENIRRVKWQAAQDNQFCRRVFKRICEVWIEKEPGSSGLYTMKLFGDELDGYAFHQFPIKGDKVERAKPLSSSVERGKVFYNIQAFDSEFFTEYELFPQDGVHDDRVDAGSGAFALLKGIKKSTNKSETTSYETPP